MSAGDFSEVSRVPCSNCGGQIQSWGYGASCNSPSSGGIQCLGCHKKFTPDELKKLEAAARQPLPSRRPELGPSPTEGDEFFRRLSEGAKKFYGN